MNLLHRSTLLSLAALGLLVVDRTSCLRAQDSVPSGKEPIVASVEVSKLIYDYLVDGTPGRGRSDANRKFTTLQAAYAAAPDGTPDQPTVIGIAPNVYLLPGGTTDAQPERSPRTTSRCWG